MTRLVLTGQKDDGGFLVSMVGAVVVDRLCW